MSFPRPFTLYGVLRSRWETEVLYCTEYGRGHFLFELVVHIPDYFGILRTFPERSEACRARDSTRSRRARRVNRDYCPAIPQMLFAIQRQGDSTTSLPA